MDVVVREYTDSDAAALAKMWNESNKGWPGGFLPFIEFTAERLREKLKEKEHIAIYVAQLGEKIVGYCSLAERSTDRGVSYIPLLNAHPDYHGKKIGKKVLLAALNESIKRGYDRLDLYTWAGNTKAVPLYKKTGFFWVPKTEVHMQNFLPLIFQNSIARRFFEKHDWYSTFARDLSVKMDEMSFNDRNAYLHEWREGEDFLKVVIDRDCCGISSIETPELYISTRLDTKKPAIGVTHNISWRLKNQTDTPQDVTIRATGEEGLKIKYQANFSLKDEKHLEAPVAVRPDFVERIKETAKCVITDVVLGGDRFSLKTGVRAKYAMELLSKPKQITINPDSSEIAHFAFTNRGDEPLEGKLIFVAENGIDFTPRSCDLKLDPKASTGVDIKVRASESRAFVIKPMLQTTIDGKKSLLPMKEFVISSLAFNGLVAASFGKEMLLQNGFVRLHGNPPKGWVEISIPDCNRSLVYHWIDQLGEPFSDEFRNLPFSGTLEESDHGKVLVMKNHSEAFPGIEIEKRVTLGRCPIVRFDYTVRNLGLEKRALKLKVHNYFADQKPHTTIPTKDGIIDVDQTDFPAYEMDLPEAPEHFAESWSALKGEEGNLAGLIWQGASKVEYGETAMPLLVFDLGVIPPLGEKSLPPLFLYAGAGDFRVVRRNCRYWIRSFRSRRPRRRFL